MKPDWKDAPEWVQWLAQDSRGCWFWYEEKPEKSKTLWMASNGEWTPYIYCEWDKTLEGRPQ